jgi:long-chain acyl-CoA synthetase
MEKTIPLILRDVAHRHPDLTALFSKDASGTFVPVSYRQHYDEVLTFASGLATWRQARRQARLMADNRAEWALADRATLSLGAADVPRGTDATEKEIAFIRPSLIARSASSRTAACWTRFSPSGPPCQGSRP